MFYGTGIKHLMKAEEAFDNAHKLLDPELREQLRIVLEDVDEAIRTAEQGRLKIKHGGQI